MIIYFLIAFLSVFLSFTENAKNFYYKYTLKYIHILIFLTLFIPSALRYGIGTDYFNTYVRLFNNINLGGKGFNEIFFTKFVYFLTNLTKEYQWFFVITSFFVIGLTVISINENSSILFFSYYLYMFGTSYLYGYSGVRQAFATSMFLFAIRYLKNNMYIKYFFCILIAYFVHRIAIVYFFVYFVHKWKTSVKFKIIFLILMFILSPFLGKLLRIIISFTPFSWYLNSKFDVNENSIFLLLMNFFTLIIGLMYGNKNDKLYNFYINMHLIATLISMYMPYLPVGSRIVNLFFYVHVLSLPYFVSFIKHRLNRIVIIVLVCFAFFVYWYYVIVVIKSLEVVPYVSIFSR